MFLKASTAGLQDDLRDTMRAYNEEKLQLRAHLSTLRLDLSQLHRDDRTVSTEEQSCAASHVSFPASSEADPELKRLVELEEDEDTKTARSGFTNKSGGGAQQLPALKGVAQPGAATTTKSLRFSSSTAMKSRPRVDDDVDGTDGCSARKSFLKDDWWDAAVGGQCDPLGLTSNIGSTSAQEAKEHQKFKELQKNQDLLRNIGRANLREKRISLIRLPTITSAKKRGQTTWDSGRNVSRPAGKSTAFESHAYVEASSRLKKKNFKIPDIRDPQRSEVQLDPDVPRQPDTHRRKRVQFTRPGDVNTSTVTFAPNVTNNPNMTAASLNTITSGAASINDASTLGDDRHNESIMGGESLNTTLADTTLGDTSFQDISFSEEQLKALAIRGSIDRGAVTDRSDDSSPRKAPGDETATTDAHGTNLLPPLKVKTLRRQNVILHDLNTSGFSSMLQPGKGNWDKASDMSVLTKISRLSVETEEWKNSYMSVPDPDKRNKTLSDIMFAVRTRMRENEASLRFGETPHPSDEAYDYLMPDPFSSPRRVRKSRKTGKVQKGRGGAGIQAPHKRRVAPDGGGQTAAQLQGYLRKVYRHRRGAGGGGGGGSGGGRSGRGRVEKPCGQEAGKIERQRGMRMPVAQEA